MIDNVLGSKTSISILRFLTRFENQYFPIEDIVKETGLGKRNVYDALRTLVNQRLIDAKISAKKSYFRFVADSEIRGQVFSILDSERKRLGLRSERMYRRLAEIESILTKIIGPNLIDILLFGSVAKGRDTAGSDVDLCIIVRRKTPNLQKKCRDKLQIKKSGNEIQMHIFSAKEFLEAKKQKNPLVINIIRDGLSLRSGL